MDRIRRFGGMNILTTCNKIFLFNAVFMGFGVRLWMQEVLSWFDRIVADVSNSTRLEQECNKLTFKLRTKIYTKFFLATPAGKDLPV